MIKLNNGKTKSVTSIYGGHGRAGDKENQAGDIAQKFNFYFATELNKSRIMSDDHASRLITDSDSCSIPLALHRCVISMEEFHLTFSNMKVNVIPNVRYRNC